MFSDPLHLFLLFFLLILPGIQSANYPTAVDFILVNCGATKHATDNSNRTWQSDEPYAVGNSASTSQASIPQRMDQSLPDQVPYQSARILNSQFKYSFPVSTGHKFLRLYFYPETYNGSDPAKSFFSLTANGFTLLSNFSASLHAQNAYSVFVNKEFIINVNGNQGIELAFSPDASSFAFVNGIEIISIPETLYFRGKDIKFVPDHLFTLPNDTALEKLYRLNVGGADVKIQDDSGSIRGMFRNWVQDDPYIYGTDFGFTPNDEGHIITYTNDTPPYSAPEIVYQTSRTLANSSISLEWVFPVDSGFNYMLRFHFCEIQLEVTKQNQRVFTIQINNQTAELEVDVIFWTGGTGIPVFRDYIAFVPDDYGRPHGKKNMSLSLFPNSDGNPLYSSVLLNGLEIFKLSDSDQSLAAANPDPPSPTNSPPPPAPPRNKRKGLSSTIYAIIGSLIGVLVVAAAVGFLIIRRRRQKVKDTVSTKSSWVPLTTGSSTTRTSGSGVHLPSDLCRQFTFGEILVATDNFKSDFIIGKGGFGNVYKGVIDNGETVAIKRQNASSNQGVREFQTEIEMLSKLRHVHLVSLIGYCYENGEMILVYDYMEHGTLRDHLYNSKNSPLKWKERLQICVGAAKGLHYLHTGTKHSIIHRDVKSTNILLDDKWVAKVADFGLSKVRPTDAANTHVSTAVKGSVGYVDPEYWRLQQLTEKSDVYSFGVVLFEVLCARPAVLQNLPRDKLNLAEWAKFCHRKGTINQLVDPNLKGQIVPECLNKFVETGIMCLGDKGIDRPSMGDIVWSLDFALQLQVAAEEGGSGVVSPTTALPMIGQRDPNTSTEEKMFSGTSETATWSRSSVFSPSSGSGEKLNSVEVFSEIKNPAGR